MFQSLLSHIRRRRIHLISLVVLICFIAPGFLYSQIQSSSASFGRAKQASSPLKKYSKPFYHLDGKFGVKANFVAIPHAAGDERLYELLVNPAIRKELRLNERISKTIGDKSNLICEKRWNAKGAPEDLRVELDQYIADQLSSEQKKSLAKVVSRCNLLELGFDEYLRSSGKPKHSRNKILGALSDMADEIKLEGNELFVGQVEILLPGYLTNVQQDDVARLPLLPLSMFLAMVNKPNAVTAKTSKCFDEFEDFGLDLRDGTWLFDGPTYRKSRSGNMFATKLEFLGWVPISPFEIVLKHVRLELVGEQFDYIRNVYQELVLNPKPFPSDISRKEKRRLIVERHHQVNQCLNTNLLPTQMVPIKNYVKLHSLFTLGPHQVFGRLGDQQKATDDQFKERLSLMQKKINDFIDNSEARLATEFANVLREEFDDDGFDKWLIDAPFYSLYEQWFQRIIDRKAKGSKKIRGQKKNKGSGLFSPSQRLKRLKET